ncbi:MAG: TIGR04190 family B12-binding domain/radical SAM domain protein [Dehalococcoidales bacterium]|jgi:B12-binding domain/radical SAM domain protein|nr:TIGR04190 family B12-binding domain/radical SAM domain protein [Dehalococcoidales bacterium]MDP7525345.1 TIGR04190 family B12-binding domain/radical SAM domain protein [Dehalococcoidales bacterium]
MPTDLILLHAPSVYDFRQKTVLYGPVSDMIPPSPVFEMYPIGLASISEYLERAGFRVRIVNLAVRMVRNSKFNAEEMIKRLKAPVFGIDLHWMVHSHGAIEVARLVKKHHPNSKLVFGGFSSSYFYKELIQYPEVDYVIRGDSTEEPFRLLMDCIRNGTAPDTVPNLVWKDSRSETQENPFTNIPEDLNNVMDKHYEGVIRSVFRYRDLISYIPFRDWLRYPITAVLTCRGCTHSCIICGGSAAAFRHIHHRDKPVFRTPEQVFKDIKQIEGFSRGPLFVLGDLCQQGEDYAFEILKLLRQDPVKNQIIFELFGPTSADLLKEMGRVAPNFCLEISPESHDPEIRKIVGRNYSNEDLEQTLSDALDAGCGRLDVFFMTGLPKQTTKSVMDTVEYCGHLLEKFKGDKRLFFFIAPISPFLDPGSLAFEHPERYGYKVLFRTMEEYRQALVSPNWKDSLNYETEWMTRDEIAESAYESIRELIRLKARWGVISPEMADLGEKRIEAGWEMMHRLEKILAGDNREEELARIKPEVDRINAFPVSEKIQLELPVRLMSFKILGPLWAMITGKK